jgi:hypothetical protein
MAYCSRAFGIAFTPLTFLPRHLEELQRNQSKRCSEGVQVRVVAGMLKPEEGVYVLPHSTLSEERIKKAEEAVELLIRKAELQLL